MDIISFFSYKGGVGRTYLTMQIARCLAGLGKRVIVVDFDFDAPGIPGIFQKNSKEVGLEGEKEGYYDNIKGGIYDLIIEFMIHKDKSNQNEFLKRLENYLIPIEEEGMIKDDAGKVKGSIRILASGKINPTYLIDVSSVEWMHLVTAANKEDSLLTFLEDSLFPALNQIKEKPDYLLFDSRAGITHYGGILQNVAKHQCMIVTPNLETNHVLREYLIPKISGLNVRKLNSFVFAVSRIPGEFSEMKDELFTETKTYIENKLTREMSKISHVLKISSDLKTYYKPYERTLDNRYAGKSGKKAVDEGEIQIVQLHEDILTLLAGLCPDEAKEAVEAFSTPEEETIANAIMDENAKKDVEIVKEAHALWYKIFGYKFRLSSENVVFETVNNVMRNIVDQKQNVAFRVETFLNLLEEIYKTLVEKDVEKELVFKAFELAGERCGLGFASDILEKWKNDNKEYTLIEKIDQWSKFDTRTGFGKIRCVSGDDSTKMTITVQNAFTQLVNEKGEIVIEYNQFFKGYIIGVLKKFGEYHKKDITICSAKESKENKILEYDINIKNININGV